MDEIIKHKKLSDFKPTANNSNKHTAKGMKALDNSMGEGGYTAPMTAAADGEIIDGDARLETAGNRFGDEALVIEHDGSKPVVMIRTDIENASSPAARRIHYRANLTAWQNLELDDGQVMADMEGGFDFEAIDISLGDLGKLLDTEVDIEKEWEGMPEFKQEDLTSFKKIIVHFASKDDMDLFAKLIEQTVTDKTQSLWYPKAKIERFEDKESANIP